MSETPVIKLRGVGVRFGEHEVLSGIDLAIHPHETLAVVGESGCGKTTLGRAIVGLLEPTGGEIRVEGERVGRRSRELRRRIQVIFQNP